MCQSASFRTTARWHCARWIRDIHRNILWASQRPGPWTFQKERDLPVMRPVLIFDLQVFPGSELGPDALSLAQLSRLLPSLIFFLLGPLLGLELFNHLANGRMRLLVLFPVIHPLPARRLLAGLQLGLVIAFLFLPPLELGHSARLAARHVRHH